MVRPEDLKDLPEEYEDEIRELEEEIIVAIVKDASNKELAAAGITAAMLANRKKLVKYVEKVLLKSNAKVKRKMEILLQIAFNKQLSEAADQGYDIKRAQARARRIMEDGLKAAGRDIDNLTGSMGLRDKQGRLRSVGQAYVDKLNEAAVAVQSGTMTYDQATKKVCLDLAERGLETVNYITGHIDRMDVAARRAIITGVNQTAARMTEALINEWHAGLVETTAHVGARPDHQVWQGQIFSYDGKDPNYPDFVSSTGYGDVTGLCGANCRHNFFIFWPGASERAYTDEELAEMDPIVSDENGREMTYYEATQKQRAQERAMRKTKRQIKAYEAAELEEEKTAARAKLQKQRKRYREFSKAVGMRAQYERTAIY